MNRRPMLPRTFGLKKLPRTFSVLGNVLLLLGVATGAWADGMPLEDEPISKPAPLADEIFSEISWKLNLYNIPARRVGRSVVVTFPNHELLDDRSGELTDEGWTRLEEMAQVLGDFRFRQIDVVGHVDPKETLTKSVAVSEQTALAVSDAIQDLNILAWRISSSGRGSGQAVATNRLEAGRQKNRRVEIFLR